MSALFYPTPWFGSSPLHLQLNSPFPPSFCLLACPRLRFLPNVPPCIHPLPRGDTHTASREPHACHVPKGSRSNAGLWDTATQPGDMDRDGDDGPGTTVGRTGARVPRDSRAEQPGCRRRGLARGSGAALPSRGALWDTNSLFPLCSFVLV